MEVLGRLKEPAWRPSSHEAWVQQTSADLRVLLGKYGMPNVRIEHGEVLDTKDTFYVYGARWTRPVMDAMAQTYPGWSYDFTSHRGAVFIPYTSKKPSLVFNYFMCALILVFAYFFFVLM